MRSHGATSRTQEHISTNLDAMILLTDRIPLAAQKASSTLLASVQLGLQFHPVFVDAKAVQAPAQTSCTNVSMLRCSYMLPTHALTAEGDTSTVTQ
jgi:hypothetical protein